MSFIPRDERAVDYQEPLLPEPGARVKLESRSQRRLLPGTVGNIQADDGDDDPLLTVTSPNADPDWEAGAEPTKNQLGTINGVYIPCLLNILGAVLFMRVGYVVGFAGWSGALILFGFSNLVAVLTALSFSAIVTNGKMGGGGVYYMIARSMGPAFGGATGLLFYLCYCINSAFNATAMVEDIVTVAFKEPEAWHFTALYHGTLFFLLLVALAGADAFARLNAVLFFALVSSAIVALGSLLFSHPHVVETVHANTSHSCHHIDPALSDETTVVRYSPPGTSRFVENFGFAFTDKNDVTTVLALVYTTTCGIMVGANLSGDLKDPGQSLPRGTLGAMATSFTTYIVFATVLAMTFDRRSLQCVWLVLQKASGRLSYFVITGVAMATLSTALGAMFGAARIFQAIARDRLLPVSYFAKGTRNGDEPLRAVVLTWILVNCFGYIGGGSVQGIAAILTDFFLTACAFVNLSQMLLCLSNAPNYRPTFKYATWWSSGLGFLLTIGLMWFLDVEHAAITCGLWIIVFVYIKLTVSERPWGDVVQAILFRTVVTRLRDLVQRKDHAKFWRASVLLLLQDGDHPLLTLCKHLTNGGLFIVGTALVDSNAHSGKGGDDVNGDAATGGYAAPEVRRGASTAGMLPQFQSAAAVTKSAWLWLIDQAQLNAFVSVGVGADLYTTFRTMISCTGLGALVPNTVVLPYQEPWYEGPELDFVTRVDNLLHDSGRVGRSGIRRCCRKGSACNICNPPEAHNSSLDIPDSAGFVRLLKEVLDQERNVMVVRNSAGLDPVFHRMRGGGKLLDVVDKTLIDVWIAGDWDWASMESSVALLIQHAHLLTESFGKRFRMRIIQHVQYTYAEEQVVLQQKLEELVLATRIPKPELMVIPPVVLPPRGAVASGMDEAGPALTYARALNELMQDVSRRDTAVTLLELPHLPDPVTPESAETYVACLNALTVGLPPLALLRKGERTSIISLDI